MRVVDGNALPLPDAKLSGKTVGLRHEVSFHMQRPVSELRALAGSRRVAGRTCDKRWLLSGSDLVVLRELVMRFQEERALLGIQEPMTEQVKSTPVTAL